MKITESLPAHPVVEIAPGRVGRIHSAYPALENQENRADVTQLWNNITAAIQGGKESSRILNLAKTGKSEREISAICVSDFSREAGQRALDWICIDLAGCKFHLEFMRS